MGRILSKYIVPVLLSPLLLSAACSEANDPGPGNLNINVTCMAYNCHNGTQLRIFPPVSGLHMTHFGGENAAIGCETCHYHHDKRTALDTRSSPLHKNGIINGWNWLYNINAPGEIVNFDPNRVPGGTWNDTTRTCGGLPDPPCHGNEVWE